MKTIDELQNEVNELSSRLKSLEHAKINNETITAKDILYIHEKIAELNTQLSEIRSLNNKAEEEINLETKKQFNEIPVQQSPHMPMVENEKIHQNHEIQKSDVSVQSDASIQKDDKKTEKTFDISEANIGKYIVGVLASILILIATGMFVKTIWAAIPNIAKFGTILTIGTLISLVGWTKIIKLGNKNGFWTSITGCGTAITFISIISGGLIWNLYGLTISGMLMIVWFSVNFILSGKSNSNIFYIITYIGGIISLTLSIISFTVDTSIANQIGFIFMVIVMLCFGEYGIYKNKNFLIPWLNLIFSFVTVSLIYTSMKNIFTMSLLQVFMSAVLLFESQRVLSDSLIEYKIIKSALSCVSAIFITASVIILFNAENLFENNFSAFVGATSLLIIFVVGITQIKNAERIKFMFLGVSPIAALLFGAISYGTVKSLSMFPLSISVIMSFNSKIRNDKINRLSSVIFYAVSYCTFFEFVYNDLSETMIWANCIMLSSVLIIDYILITFKEKSQLHNTERTVNIIILFIAMWLASGPLKINMSALLLIISIIIAAHRLLVLNNEVDKESVDYNLANILYIIILLVIHLIGYVCNIFVDYEYERAMFTAAIILLSTVMIYDSLKFKNILCTIFSVLACNVNMFYLSAVWPALSNALFFSMAGIIVSALFIMLGFMFRHKDIRILGLITMIIYVLKIVFIDVSLSSGKSTNIAMLLFGGIVCYSISFAYNKLNKIYGRDFDKNITTQKDLSKK